MKNAVLLMILLCAANFAVKGQSANRLNPSFSCEMSCRCQMVLINVEERTFNVNLIFSGNNENDIASINLTIAPSIPSSDRLNYPIQMSSRNSSSGNGHVWSFSGSAGASSDISKYDSGIIQVTRQDGTVIKYEVFYSFGKGTKNSTTSASAKPQLL